jgi:hypothetical protein
MVVTVTVLQLYKLACSHVETVSRWRLLHAEHFRPPLLVDDPLASEFRGDGSRGVGTSQTTRSAERLAAR